MEPGQKTTQEQLDIEEAERKIAAEKLLKYQQEIWIDFNAVGGLILEADGTFKMSERRFNSKGMPMKYTVTDLAEDLGLDRGTLYRWTKAIPDFWGRVAERRKTIAGGARVAKVWNGVFLKAAQGHAPQAAMFLANFDDDFRMPTQPVEHGLANSWAKLLEGKRKSVGNITEGEVVNHGETKAV